MVSISTDESMRLDRPGCSRESKRVNSCTSATTITVLARHRRRIVRGLKKRDVRHFCFFFCSKVHFTRCKPNHSYRQPGSMVSENWFVVLRRGIFRKVGSPVLHVDRVHGVALVKAFHVLVRVRRVSGLIGTIGALVAWLLPVACADYVTFQVDFRRVIVRTVQTLIRFRAPRAVVVPLVVVSWNRSERSCFLYVNVTRWCYG